MRVDAVLRSLTLALVAGSLCWPVIAAPTMSGSSLPTGASGDFLRHDGTAWDNSTIGVTDLPAAAVKTTSSYSDPAWITDLAKSKVALGNVENTALSTWAGTTNLVTAGALTTTTLTTGAATVSSLVSSGAVSGTTGTFTTGPVLINGTVAYGEVSRGHQLELQTTGVNYGGIAMTNWSAGGYDHILDFQLAKSNTPGNYSAVTTNDVLGRIRGLGADGDQFVEAGGMYFLADAAVSNNVVPGRWSLYTSNASGASVEALRINSGQIITTLAANPSNITAAGAGIFKGGLAITDVLNAWIDDAATGSGTVTHYIGNQSITTSSDRRIKTAIKPTGLNGLETVKALGVVDFRWAKHSTQAKSYNGDKQIPGLIAQDVAKVLPMLVNTNGLPAEGPLPPGQEWKIDYQAMVPVLIKALQEEAVKREALEARLLALESNVTLRAPPAAKPTAKPKAKATPKPKRIGWRWPWEQAS